MSLQILISNPTIVLDDDVDTPTTLSGVVELELKEPMRLKAIKLTLVGRTKLQWRESE